MSLFIMLFTLVFSSAAVAHDPSACPTPPSERLVMEPISGRSPNKVMDTIRDQFDQYAPEIGTVCGHLAENPLTETIHLYIKWTSGSTRPDVQLDRTMNGNAINLSFRNYIAGSFEDLLTTADVRPSKRRSVHVRATLRCGVPPMSDGVATPSTK